MKRFLLSAAALLACTLVFAGTPHKVKAAKATMTVEACKDNIFRVRVSPDGEFPESLMERYGIVKSDWAPVGEKVSKKGQNWVMTTNGYTLTVNTKTGAITIVDASGKQVMGEVSFVPASDAQLEKVAKVINDKFSKMTVASNGGIIGDDNGQFSEKDKAESGDPAKSCMVSVKLSKDERFYGGGSTSREHIQHRGEILRMWTTYQHTEIPMPFMMSSKGWGIYNNTTRKNYFDCGATISDKLNIYNTCPDADVYILLGGDMPGVLDNYTQITGRTYVLPKYAYGFCFGPNMREDQFAILNDAAHFNLSEVPVDLFWLEPQWMEKRYDFSMEKKWNYDRFSPEPYWVQNKFPKKEYGDLFIGKLHDMGIRLGLWLCEEYDHSITEEDIIAEREGREQSGQPHWMDHLKTFLDYGIDGFKLDPARTIDEHTFWKYYNGRTDKEMHNLNQVLLPKQCIEMARGYKGKRIWEHYCGGWAGVQRYGAATSGDNGGGKVALYDQLNLSMSGYMNISCDVMSVDKSIQMESLHFGMFIPWVQVNSWFSMRHPFYFGEQQQRTYREYVQYRYEIMPYIYSLALECSQNGMPMLRSMPLVFPDDRKCDDMCFQYMFGPSYCVAIFDNSVYLPAGTWYDAWTGEKIVSKGEVVTREYAPYRAGLLYIKEGAIIPTQEKTMHLGVKPVDTFTLKVYPSGKSSFTMYEDDGDSFGYETGAVSKTLFECSQNGSAVELVANPVEGSFTGMPQSRTYKFEILLASKPVSVSANGKAVADWTYGEDGKLRFELPAVSVSEKVTVNVK